MSFSERAHVVLAAEMQSTSYSTGPNDVFTRNIKVTDYHDLDMYIVLGQCATTGTAYVIKVSGLAAGTSAGTIIDDYTYRITTSCTASTGDTWGAITAGSTAGSPIITASSNTMMELHVDCDALGVGFDAVKAQIVTATTPMTLCCVGVLSNPRYAQNQMISVFSTTWP
jgi:hypothetical protein